MAHVAILPTGVLGSIPISLNTSLEPIDSGDTGLTSLRFLRLPHPRTSLPSLFLPYIRSPRASPVILEVQVVAPTNKRSWFALEEEVLEDGQLLLFTPIDPAFLLIPLLRSIRSSNSDAFRPLDDIFDDVRAQLSSQGSSDDGLSPSQPISSNDLSALFSLDCVRSGMRRICELKEITPEITVFRYSMDKVLEYMRGKVARLSRPEIAEVSRTVVRNLARDGLMEDGKESLLESGRLKSACEVLSHYLPGEVCDALLASYDFSELEAHNSAIRREKPPSVVVSTMKPTSKRDSNLVTDEPENGKKRKAKGSHGVEKLKKADTKGMAKLSNFFQKTS